MNWFGNFGYTLITEWVSGFWILNITSWVTRGKYWTLRVPKPVKFQLVSRENVRTCFLQQIRQVRYFVDTWGSIWLLNGKSRWRLSKSIRYFDINIFIIIIIIIVTRQRRVVVFGVREGKKPRNAWKQYIGVPYNRVGCGGKEEKSWIVRL